MPELEAAANVGPTVGKRTKRHSPKKKGGRPTWAPSL